MTSSYRSSKMATKLARQEPVCITCLHLTDPSVYELAGMLGFDGIWMDFEHHAFSLETGNHLMRAARVGGADIMARPGKGEFMRMCRLLESGASAILYPRCDDAQEAALVAKWAKFAPIGSRGADAANPDNPYLLTPLEPYLKLANENTLVFVQIEDPQALENVEEIINVEGVDALFFGPGDFSILAGVPGQGGHPLIKAAKKRIAAAAKKAGKHWGLPVGTDDGAKEALDMGARILCRGADIVMVKLGLEAVLASWQKLGMNLAAGPAAPTTPTTPAKAGKGKAPRQKTAGAVPAR